MYRGSFTFRIHLGRGGHIIVLLAISSSDRFRRIPRGLEGDGGAPTCLQFPSIVLGGTQTSLRLDLMKMVQRSSFLW